MAQATTDPEGVVKAKEEVKQMKAIHSKIHTVSTKFADNVNKAGQTKLHATFTDWSQLEQGRQMPSKIGPALEKIAELQHALDSLHLALSSQLQEAMVAPFRKFVEMDCRNAQALASKQEDARLEYDITVNNFKGLEKKSGAKWDEKKKAAEAAMNLAAAKYEQLNDEVIEQSQQLNISSQILVQERALQYIRALEHHFEHGRQMMANLSGFTQDLESNVQQLKEAEAEMLRQQQEAHAANMAAQAETQAASEAASEVPPPYSPEASAPPSYDEPAMGAPPSYDQPPSDYGAPPGYDQPPADYGAPPPGYDQPPPGYDQPPPGYDQPPPGYDQPPPGYDQPPPGYGQAPPGYDQPPPGYDQPPPGYDQPPPNPGFGGPPSYGQPPPGYDQPPPGYDG